MKHTVEVKENSAGYIWVCSCGQVWSYGMHNLDAVNAHTGVGTKSTKASQGEETWAERCAREAILSR
jgi:hypothetical protein